MNQIAINNRPWYRHPWPWILMAGPLIVVVAAIFTAWIAVTTDDDLVVDDYYKQGLEVNKVLERDKAAAALQLEARLRLVDGQITVQLVSHANAPLPAQLRVTLVHPIHRKEDRKLTLSSEGSDGVYTSTMAPIGPAHWQAIIEDEAATWRLSGKIHLPDVPHVLLTAREK